MNRLFLPLVMSSLTLAGCDVDATISEKTHKSNTAGPEHSRDSTGKLAATVVKTRLVPFKTAQGLATQAVIVDWKNTGTRAIRAVDAEIILYDSDGSLVEGGTDSYTIYATSDFNPGILPGKTYREPRDEGFIVMPSGPKASRADVRIIAVTETSGF